jgi:hypothetical protein
MTTTISKGGFYQGSYLNEDPTQPAILINTTEPVEIAYSLISSKGHGIIAIAGSNVTLTQSFLIANNPNVAGQMQGMGIQTPSPGSLLITSCLFEGWSRAILVQGQPGVTSLASIKILFNKFDGNNGFFSNGNNGWQPFTIVSGTDVKQNYGWSSVITLMGMTSDPNIVIQWNEITRIFSSEDCIDIYECSGTKASPILVKNNFIEGPLPYDPSVNDMGIAAITTDGAAIQPALASQWITIDGNIIVRARAGVNLWNGSNLVSTNNYVAFNGLQPNGTKYNAQMNGKNSGVILWFGVTPNQETNTSVNDTVAMEGAGYTQQSPTQVVSGMTVLPANSENEAQGFFKWEMLLRTNGLRTGPTAD